MENVYTCICGNQTWTIHESAVCCIKCQQRFELALMSVKDFNKMVNEEIELEEEEV